ncbi:MAG: hypothetical protein D6B28_01265 [Gammaproteobacteria bacterium]|nr:MAG: hypothetical protein D6B28_01265 [Gammaproteobacteria bacterium]
MKYHSILILLIFLFTGIQSATAAVIVTDVQADVITYDNMHDTDPDITDAKPDNLTIDPSTGTISGHGRGDSDVRDPATTEMYDTLYSISFDKTYSTRPKLTLSGNLFVKGESAGGNDIVYISLSNSTTEIYHFGIGAYSDGDVDGETYMSFSETIDISAPGEYFLTVGTNTVQGEWGPEFAYASFSFNATLTGDSYRYTPPAPVPVPACIWLFMSGCGLFGSFSRRK